MYPKEVYDNVPKYLLIILIIFITLSILSLIFIQPYNKITADIVDKLIENEETYNNSNDEINNTDKENNPENDDFKKHLFTINPLLYGGIALCSYCK
jgi:GTP-sensing pleiotropic transcriptional regulator CodY